MPTRIKPKRGSGSPAGSLEQYEIAMDVNTKTLYVSTDGVDAVVLAQNISNNTTDNLTEGSTNQYYTDARVDARIALIDTFDQLTVTDVFRTTGNETILGYDLDSLNRLSVTPDNITLLADYSHPVKFYGEPGVENGEVNMWVYGGFGGALDAFALTTAGGNEFLRMVTYDTGGGDDGSHETVMVLRGDAGNYLYSRDTSGGLGLNVPLQMRMQELTMLADDAIIMRVNGENILELTNFEILVEKPINSNSDITSTGTVTGNVVAATTNITAGGDITATGDITGNSISAGTSGNYFTDEGTVNAKYLNLQSPENYNSTSQFVHTLDTDDTFHQFIRFKTDMTDQTPYDHNFTFFGVATSDANGTENIGSVEYGYRTSGLHEINLSSEFMLDGAEIGGLALVGGDHTHVKFGTMAKLHNIQVLGTAPVDPNDGDRYIDTTDGELKIAANGNWFGFTPEYGSMVYDITNNRTLIYTAGAWRAVTTTAI